MAHFHIDHSALVGESPDKTKAAEQTPPKAEFQNVFDFPDFVEMRPQLRSAVHTVAAESFDQPVLPVKIERMAVALEEQMERETRKYEQQTFVYANQKTEVNDLIRLYTHVLQVISRTTAIDTDIEDLIFAVNSTRRDLQKLPTHTGTGPLYDADSAREIIPDTFYDLVIRQLAQPYFLTNDHEMKRKNVTKKGQHLVARMTAYAFRDWDAYLTHEYDAQHLVKNERNLSDFDYYEKSKNVELKYADKAYAQVFADTYQDFLNLLVPTYLERFEIQTTPLPKELQQNAKLRIQLQTAVRKHFLIDDAGYEHVMDAPTTEINNKYKFYEENF
ncbi:hypothetical protein [Loigolactobacillus iwatensis]|uniref:hypothetical protein n=1 Tax=Loigolactobacillus iwatensis TaxID=1267156 RepID=UPI000F7E42A8|nr:hypothetical protein [Loigolactobacillus iwatensis]